MFDKVLGKEKKNWQPNIDSVVPRYLVHKSFVGEVFLSDSCKDSDGSFLLSAIFPQAHCYYNDSSQKIDVSLLLEVFRQCSIYVSHIFYSIPLDFKFIFDSAHFNLIDTHCINTKHQYAIVVVKVIEEKIKRGNLNGLILEMSMYCNTQLCATKIMDISFLQPKLWQKLRHVAQYVAVEQNEIELIPKEIGGKKLDSNIVVSDIVCSFDLFYSTIVPNTNHPAFFDHPLDHIPASLLFEALRQHALIVACKLLNIPTNCLLLVEVIAEFKSFCEFFNINQCYSKKENIKIRDNQFIIDIEVVAKETICVVSQLKFSILGGKDD